MSFWKHKDTDSSNKILHLIAAISESHESCFFGLFLFVKFNRGKKLYGALLTRCCTCRLELWPVTLSCMGTQYCWGSFLKKSILQSAEKISFPIQMLSEYVKDIVPRYKGWLPTNEPAREHTENENWVWWTANKFASHIQVCPLRRLSLQHVWRFKHHMWPYLGKPAM